MTDHTAKMIGLIYAEVAKMEAMKTENESRKDKGYSQAYGESSFDEVVNSIAHYANSIQT